MNFPIRYLRTPGVLSCAGWIWKWCWIGWWVNFYSPNARFKDTMKMKKRSPGYGFIYVRSSSFWDMFVHELYRHGPHKITKFERRRMVKANLKNQNHSFSVDNFNPQTTFADIKQFTYHAAIQKSSDLNLYFEGLRLPLSMKMSSFISRFPTNSLSTPILIYP